MNHNKLALVGIVLLLVIALSCFNSKKIEAAGTGGYEKNVVAYCRAIQSGDYDATIPLTLTGAEALRRAKEGPSFERESRIAELRKLQREDIERLYKQILPPSAQWKILEVVDGQISGTKVVFLEIRFPVKEEADFKLIVEPPDFARVKQHYKKAIYYAPVEQKSKLLVDLPNFRPLSEYKILETWD